MVSKWRDITVNQNPFRLLWLLLHSLNVRFSLHFNDSRFMPHFHASFYKFHKGRKMLSTNRCDEDSDDTNLSNVLFTTARSWNITKSQKTNGLRTTPLTVNVGGYRKSIKQVYIRPKRSKFVKLAEPSCGTGSEPGGLYFYLAIGTNYIKLNMNYVCKCFFKSLQSAEQLNTQSSRNWPFFCFTL